MQNDKAQAISDRLEGFIRAFLAGRNDGRIPTGMLPPGLDNDKLGGWQVVDPDSVSAEEQWWLRRTHPIEVDRLYFLYPDNNCNYAKMAFIAPFGSTLHIEGEFPHSRFFDMQVSGPYDPKAPASVGFGAGEVPIVDADIDPLPGHTNPFRVGADRNAEARRYHVTFEMARGNAAELNPGFRPPAYRQQGNRRVGGPFRDAGPGFDGALHPGIVWMRYYLPDRGRGTLGGVPLPKCSFTLATGEHFWIRPASLDVVSQLQSTSVPSRVAPAHGLEPCGDSRWGWIKGFGIALVGLEMGVRREIIDANRVKQDISKGVIRSIDSRLFNRGPDRPPPGNYAVCATGCSFIHYLNRDLSIAPGYVAVVTGKLPTMPRTGDGQPRMTEAQARYWSIVHYDSRHKGYPGVLMGSINDEQITLTDHRYAIVFSADEDRPSNAAPRNGVTWNSWGQVGEQVVLIRWMSVAGGWEDPAITPNEANATWQANAWSSSAYDATILGLNRPGLLQEYHPAVHYMRRTDFEALGPQPLNRLLRERVWKD